MFQRSRHRHAAVAAGVLALTLGIAACGSDGDTETADLDGNRVGAMESYGLGDQFTATEALSFSLLYNNHPNYQIDKEWMFWDELTERTNVSLETVEVPLSDYEQKRGLLIGAGDAPFIIPKTYPGQESAYVSSGAILPISDYVDLMPHFQDKVAKWNLQGDIDSLRQQDGKYYLLPGLHEDVWTDYTIAVRTDILAELGLEEPATWDEFRDMLRAMKAAYPEVYPMSDRWSIPTPLGALQNIIGPSYGYDTMGGWGYQNASFNRQAQEFVFTGTMPEYKEMVEFLHSLVAEGLFDPESLTQDDDTAIQKLATGKSFVISTNAQTLVNDYRPALAQNNPNATIAKITRPDSPVGSVKAGSRLENGIMISSKARESENFVAMMQFIDWLWYSDEGQEFAKWGVEGVTYTKDAADKWVLDSDIDFIGINPDASKHLQKDFGFSNGVFAYGGTTELLQSTFSEEELKFQEAMGQKETLPVSPPRPFSGEEREQATLWETPLKDYVQQQTLQFILGQRDLSEWDAYVAEVEGKNAQQYIDLVNGAYQRYQEEHG
ncbi:MULTISPECIES: extracellular solute-binding protein [unclassified Solwaraspora]|uniref:ABC transporter substrate-binding protein n=1 Tax=unclassified Solwaraspora TaxID=2627926 RepID=UPI00248CAFC5|nr:MULTISPECIES: extracellular solute-binding protein [unclassified Solwaraspora]WBB95884.1 extracellular solute-binding protein [Solwaraspora sp. WMMA2059]WBC20212.1 extracellular solute-binding protein [Solwaraspora sp. WMMA2080]WJK32204.1 extracellular solute-binding protein [Solwaraspora sp. WMMA2065]